MEHDVAHELGVLRAAGDVPQGLLSLVEEEDEPVGRVDELAQALAGGIEQRHDLERPGHRAAQLVERGHLLCARPLLGVEPRVGESHRELRGKRVRDARLVGGEGPFRAAGDAERAAWRSRRTGHRRAQRVAETVLPVELHPALHCVVLLAEAEASQRSALREPVRRSFLGLREGEPQLVALALVDGGDVRVEELEGAGEGRDEQPVPIELAGERRGDLLQEPQLVGAAPLARHDVRADHGSGEQLRDVGREPHVLGAEDPVAAGEQAEGAHRDVVRDQRHREDGPGGNAADELRIDARVGLGIERRLWLAGSEGEGHHRSAGKRKDDSLRRAIGHVRIVEGLHLQAGPGRVGQPDVGSGAAQDAHRHPRAGIENAAQVEVAQRRLAQLQQIGELLDAALGLLEEHDVEQRHGELRGERVEEPQVLPLERFLLHRDEDAVHPLADLQGQDDAVVLALALGEGERNDAARRGLQAERGGADLAVGEQREEDRVSGERRVGPGQLAIDGDALQHRRELVPFESALGGELERILLPAEDGGPLDAGHLGESLQRLPQGVGRSERGAGPGHLVDRGQLAVLPIELLDPADLLEEGADLLPEESESARHRGVEPGAGRRQRIRGAFARDGDDGVDRPRGNGGIDLVPPLSERLGDEPGKVLDEVPLRGMSLAGEQGAEGFHGDVVGPPLAERAQAAGAVAEVEDVDRLTGDLVEVDEQPAQGAGCHPEGRKFVYAGHVVDQERIDTEVYRAPTGVGGTETGPLPEPRGGSVLRWRLRRRVAT